VCEIQWTSEGLIMISSPFYHGKLAWKWISTENESDDSEFEELGTSTFGTFSVSLCRYHSFVLLPFRFVTARSECHSGSIYFVTVLLHFVAGSISVLLHLRFLFYMSITLHYWLRFTFIAAPLELLSDSIHVVTFSLQFPNSVSVLLQPH